MTHPRDPEPTIAQAALEFLFPPICAGCDEYTDSETGFCLRCRPQLDFYETPFCLTCLSPLMNWPDCPICRVLTRPLFALGNYADPLKQAIADFKFRDVRTPLPWLCDQLVQRFDTKLQACQADCLVPVPLHPTRQHERGYNQAEIIADVLTEQVAMPLETQLIWRIAQGTPQQRLKAHEREANIRGVFEASEADPGLRILLVDDVITSGSTAREATGVLEKAGHKVVGVVSLAHGA